MAPVDAVVISELCQHPVEEISVSRACAKAVIAEPEGLPQAHSKDAASALFFGELFDRPKTCHPVDHRAEREAHIAHLNMILRLLGAREQARGH